MTIGKFVAGVIVWGGLPALASAGLEFEKPLQQASVKVSDQEIGTRFAFKVTGDKPVKITDIRTFCSCVKAQTLDGKMEFQPGETGVIDTAFEVGSFEGDLKKEVLVTTDEAHAEPVRLVLELSIARLFEITPAQLVWQVGAPAEAQTVSIKVMGDEPVKVTAAVSTREGVVTTLREVVPGREYEVSAKPATTASKMLGMLRVETDSPYPRYQKRLIFFNITDRKPTAAAPLATPRK